MAVVVALLVPTSGDRFAQPVDRAAHVAGAAGDRLRHRSAVDAEVVHRGRQPVFELGVEAVLRLARLQVEEAEHQRAGEAEQRGRERDAHAAERRGEALASASNTEPASPPTFRPLMTLPTEPTVSIRPQNVPSRPRKTSRPVR